MIKIFFIFLIAFSVEMYAQKESFISFENQLRNEQIIRNFLIKERGIKTVEEYPKLLIIYCISLKDDYRSSGVSKSFPDGDVEIVDSLLTQGKNFFEIMSPDYVLKEKSRVPNPLIFSFIAYQDSMNVLCEGNQRMCLYLPSSDWQYVLHCIEQLDIQYLFFFYDLCCYYALSREGKVYKINVNKESIISF